MTFFAGPRFNPIEEDEDIKAIRAGATPPRPPTNNELASLVEQIVAQSQQPVDSSPPEALGIRQRLALSLVGATSPSGQSQVVNPLIMARTPDAQQARVAGAQQQEIANLTNAAQVTQAAEQLGINQRMAEVQEGGLAVQREQARLKALEVGMGLQELQRAVDAAKAMDPEGNGGLVDVLATPEGKALGDATLQGIIDQGPTIVESYADQPEISSAYATLWSNAVRVQRLAMQEASLRAEAAKGNPEAAAHVLALQDNISSAQSDLNTAQSNFEAALDPDSSRGNLRTISGKLAQEIGILQTQKRDIGEARILAEEVLGQLGTGEVVAQYLRKTIVGDRALTDEELELQATLRAAQLLPRLEIMGSAVSAAEELFGKPVVSASLGDDPRAIIQSLIALERMIDQRLEGSLLGLQQFDFIGGGMGGGSINAVQRSNVTIIPDPDNPGQVIVIENGEADGAEER